jgi:hypothetical protein
MLYLLTYTLLLLRHHYPVLTSCPHSTQHSLYRTSTPAVSRYNTLLSPSLSPRSCSATDSWALLL